MPMFFVTAFLKWGLSSENAIPAGRQKMDTTKIRLISSFCIIMFTMYVTTNTAITPAVFDFFEYHKAKVNYGISYKYVEHIPTAVSHIFVAGK